METLKKRSHSSTHAGLLASVQLGPKLGTQKPFCACAHMHTCARNGGGGDKVKKEKVKILHKIAREM